MYTLACNYCGSLFSSSSDSRTECPRCVKTRSAKETKFTLVAAAITAAVLFSFAPGIVISAIIYYVTLIISGAKISIPIMSFLAFIFSAAIYGVLFYKKKDWKQAGYTYLIACGASTVLGIGVWVFFGDRLSNVDSPQASNKPVGGYDYSSLPNAQGSTPVESTTASAPQAVIAPSSQPDETDTATSVEVPAPAPVEPSTPASKVPADFQVIAPEDAKSTLTAMLVNATNALKLAELKGVVDALPKPTGGDRKVARAFNEQGLQGLKQSQINEAIDFFQHGVSADASDVEVRNNYVYSLIQANKYSEAENQAGILLSQSPGRSSAWINLSEIYAGKGNTPESAMAMIVAFQFSSNKDKVLLFLKEKSMNPQNLQMQDAARLALQMLERP